MKTILTTHFIICMLFLPGLLNGQTNAISGKVTNTSGEALQNVSIFESKRKIGTITNENGFFKLILTKGELNLKIEEIGFEEFAQEILLTRDTIFNVELKPVLQNKSSNKKQTNLSAEAKTTKKYVSHRRFK